MVTNIVIVKKFNITVVQINGSLQVFQNSRGSSGTCGLPMVQSPNSTLGYILQAKQTRKRLGCL